MDDKKTPPRFTRLNLLLATKREIDMIAAAEQRNVYAVISDMVEIYKAVMARGKKGAKSAKPITVAEFIAKAG